MAFNWDININKKRRYVKSLLLNKVYLEVKNSKFTTNI